MDLQEAIQIVKQIYQTDVERINDEKAVIEKFGSMFNPINLENLSAEGDPDSRLKYSLEPIKDLIQLKFYKISITIS